jgi:hypothetical protein
VKRSETSERVCEARSKKGVCDVRMRSEAERTKNLGEMIEFLMLCRDKVDIAMGKIAVREPLIEVSAMLTTKIEELEKILQSE